MRTLSLKTGTASAKKKAKKGRPQVAAAKTARANARGKSGKGVSGNLGAVVRARIDQRIKDDATAVLAAVGMTPSDAFRMLMVRVVAEKALPFEPLIPNRETIAAMQSARKGALTKVRSVNELLDSLNADD